MAKYRKTTAPELYRELRRRAGEVLKHTEELQQLDAASIDEVRFQLLSVEGRAAQMYWGAIKEVVPAELNWPGRKTRGAKDGLNAALNYGYGILYGQVERALVLAGLDPYAGFIHVDRPGKPSLTLDVIEEFRQPVVDRTVLGLANKGLPFKQGEDSLLTDETRRTLADKVLERLEESTERYENKKQALRVIIQNQARHLATFLRGERASYTPFACGW
jgi:CRISPR-associated protein Cas1